MREQPEVTFASAALGFWFRLCRRGSGCFPGCRWRHGVGDGAQGSAAPAGLPALFTCQGAEERRRPWVSGWVIHKSACYFQEFPDLVCVFGCMEGRKESEESRSWGK